MKHLSPLWLPLLLFLTVAEARGGISYHIQAASDAVVNDYYQVEFVLEGVSSLTSRPSFPSFAGFQVVSGPNETSSVSIINGVRSSSYSWKFVLIPLQTGVLTIEPSTIQLGGRHFRTQPLKVKVRKNGRAGAGGNPDIFLRGTVSTTSPFVGEQVIYELKVYFKVNIKQYQLEDFQRTAGFLVEEFPQQRNPVISKELYRGEEYKVAVIRRLALFPTTDGELEIPAAAAVFDVQVRKRRRSRGDIFDQFFNDSFFDYQTQSRRAVSRAVKLNVRPLPSPAPEDFNGLVGNFQLQGRLTTREVQTNDPVTFTVVVKGTGNIKLIPEPKLQLPPDIESYPPEVKTDIERKNTIKGSKTFQYLLVPRHPGDQLLKPFHFSYFDPRREEYVSLTLPEMTIHVTRSENYNPSSGAILRSGETIRTYGTDIIHIHEEIPEFQPRGYTFLARPWFQALWLAAWLLPLVTFLELRRREKRQQDLRGLRRRRAGSTARRYLREARTALKQREGTKYFSLIQQALVNFLADKEGISAAGMVLEKQLRSLQERGIAPEVLEKLRHVYNACDFARYSGAGEEPDPQLYDEAAEVIGALEELL